MQLTALQKSTAQAIVNIFETGSVRGNYGDVTLLPGDAGQLTYGRSQTTLASGNLYLLIQDYCARSDGQLSTQLKPYLPQLEACDSALNTNLTFRGLLKDAGDDPVMQEVQDSFFDQIYWDPAMRSAEALGVQTPLGAAVVYDSTVHGSWAHVRDLTRQQFGELPSIGEQKWISDYVDTRRQWLATYPNPLLHKTVYRMDAFRLIIDAKNWTLALPLSVRGEAITQATLSSAAPVNVPAESTPRRLLRLKAPPLTGPDVSWLQQRLTLAGIKIADSGTFDAATDAAVKAFQAASDLTVDGIVGPATRAALEDVPVLKPKAAVAAVDTAPMPAVPVPKIAIPIAPVSLSPQPAAPTIGAPGAAAEAPTVADIKAHVSNEVKAGVQAVQSTIAQQHKQIADLVAPKNQNAAAPKAGIAAAVLKGVTLTGRPGIAAGVSAATLAVTETRDAVAWVSSGPWSAAVKRGAPLVPIPGFPPLPQSMADIGHFLSGAYGYVHALAAMVPNEWMFRLRMFAFALLCYALYRLVAGHVDIARLKSDVAEGEQIAQEAQQVAGAIKVQGH